MGGRREGDRDPAAPPAETDAAPSRLSDIPITDRWAPLVRDPADRTPPPPRLGRRLAAAALSLIVLALVLWAIA